MVPDTLFFSVLTFHKLWRVPVQIFRFSLVGNIVCFLICLANTVVGPSRFHNRADTK